MLLYDFLLFCFSCNRALPPFFAYVTNFIISHFRPFLPLSTNILKQKPYLFAYHVLFAQRSGCRSHNIRRGAVVQERDFQGRQCSSAVQFYECGSALYLANRKMGTGRRPNDEKSIQGMPGLEVLRFPSRRADGKQTSMPVRTRTGNERLFEKSQRLASLEAACALFGSRPCVL